MKTILCYGDSNTYGYVPETGMRYPEEVRWPGALRALLGDGEYRVIEEGCNGRTASVTPEDEEWKDGRPYLKACLNSHKPLDWVVLMLGSNDLKYVFHAETEQIAQSIHWMLQVIGEFLEEKQGFRPKVLLISPPYIGEGVCGSDFGDRFDETSIEKSKKLAGLYEAEAKAFAESGKLQCEFLDAAKIISASPVDSLHLSSDAHETLAKAVANIICC